MKRNPWGGGEMNREIEWNIFSLFLHVHFSPNFTLCYAPGPNSEDQFMPEVSVQFLIAHSFILKNVFYWAINYIQTRTLLPSGFPLVLAKEDQLEREE